MTPLIPKNDRFKQAMLPSLLMGVLTNVYIWLLFFYLDLQEAFFSPLSGLVFFIAAYFMLKLNVISSKLIFIIAGYLVAVEVFIHTYYLGWDSGFFYFIFLLPTVFLLNTTWKTWAVITYSSSIIAIICVLRNLFFSSQSAFPISEEVQATISLLNASLTGIVVLVVMHYFSKTIAMKDEALVVANNELEYRNKEISNQHSHLQVLLKEVHHRVKNNLQIISSLMSLQERNIEDEEVAAVLNESKRRVEAIALIHQKLYQDNKVNRVDFNSYLHEFIKTQKIISSKVTYHLSSIDAELSLDASVPLGLILSEIITNSVKHAFKSIENPSIEVELTKNNEHFVLFVKDNGVGLPEDFDLLNPKSLGMEIIVALTEQIDGEIEVVSNQGTTFKISFVDKLTD